MSVEHFHLSEIFGVFQLNYLVEDFRRYFFTFCYQDIAIIVKKGLLKS